ncbi:MULTISPECIES: iron transporter [Natrialbaceae]|uniref:iron transporter n=1 Tax=Natrialbaceae TaxID=1644061 RepID=UPI00207D03CC|nr:iron transporter [Natronococcus sp. CG52]
MDRRDILRGTAAACTLGAAGCLERLGFEEESAWANPPLVEDRPNAVYLPASAEEMGVYGTTSEGDVALELSYTFPHRFWVPGQGGSRVEVDADDSIHLMLTVWDVETGTVLPVDVTLELRQEGEQIDGVGGSPWPMLSQRMGFHYGDNVRLPGEGEYTLSARVGPVDAVRTGAFEGRLNEPVTLEVAFAFDRSDIHDLEFTLVDEDRRGERDALPLMDHEAGHGHGDGNGSPPPTSRGPPVDDLPGDLLGTERSADAKISAVEADLERFGDDSYLAVFPRTPYNDVVLPLTSLTATIDRDGSTAREEPLSETLDHEFGHHYGTAIDPLEASDEVTVAVDAPPQVSRHDGYETAFFEFEDVTFTIG